jgi:tetratricopeptide (TPR) repeat protein
MQASTVAMILLIIGLVYLDIRRDAVLVESFGVPKKYEEVGLTSPVLTQRVVDAVKLAEGTVYTSERKDKDLLILGTDQDILTEFEIPGTKFSLRTSITAIRKLLRVGQRHLSGDIAFTDQNHLQESGGAVSILPLGTQIRIRLSRGDDNELPKTVQVATTAADKVTQQMAETILQELNPFVLAYYLGLTKNDFSQSIAITKMHISVMSPERDPHSVAKWYNLRGLIYRNAGRYDDAVSSFQKATEYDSAAAPPYNNMGIVWLEQGNYDAAIPQFKKALTVDPNLAPAYSNLGGALYEQDKSKFSEAIEDFKMATKVDKKFATVYFNWGSVLLEQGHTAEARIMFQKAHDLGLLDPKLYFLWGDSFQADEKTGDAIEMYQTADRLGLRNPDLYEHWEHAAKTRSQAGTPPGVTDSALYEHWGDALYQSDDCQSAIIKYEQASTLKQNDYRILNSLGIALFSCGKTEDSISNYTKAISLNSAYPDAHYSLGIAFESEHKFGEAIVQFQKAIDLEPQFADAYVHWGRTLDEEGKCTAAIEKFQKALELDSENAYAYNYSGVVLEQQDKSKEAIALFQKAIEIRPDELKFHYFLGLALQQAGLPGGGGELQKAGRLTTNIVADSAKLFKMRCSQGHSSMKSETSKIAP